MSAFICRAYSRVIFESPEQAAIKRNNSLEWKHQYALAYLNRGKTLETELLKRKTDNEKKWDEVKFAI